MDTRKETVQDTLPMLHEALLYLTDEVDRICRKNDITYSLTGGSMLGAVRHKGFIPWDDDMDIAMLRPEYERFLAVCKSDLRDDFEIQTIETDPEYFYGYGKILLKGTSLVQQGHERTKCKKAIFVDIFPLDTVPANPALRKKQGAKNYVLNKLLERKAGCSLHQGQSIGKRAAYCALEIVSRMVPFEFMRKRLIENMTSCKDSDSLYVCNFGGYYGYEKETTLKKYFEQIEYTAFEDRQYPVSRFYDEYLTSIYGDYMKLPPVEKRRAHNFQYLDFGSFILGHKEE